MGLGVKGKVASRLLKPILNLHSLTYEWSGKLAVMSSGGVHPKHGIIRYHDWFTDRIQKGWVVLDVGSHNGTMAAVMAGKAGFVYGIETQPAFVEAAKKKHDRDNIEFICADATRFDFGACRPIDCITLSNVLEHIEHRVEFLAKLIRQVAWKDPSRKTILLRVPMIDREWIAVYKKRLGLDYRLDKTHFTEYTAEELERELVAAGVSIRTKSVVFGETYAVCEA